LAARRVHVPRTFLVERHWLHVRTNIASLFRPVGADFLPPSDKTAFERSRPLHVGGHESESSVDISHVECRVGCAEQLSF
jgi:hypothetical protein